MRFSLLVVVLASVCLGSNAYAINESTTLPMHVINTSFGPCPPAVPDPCDPGPPTTNMVALGTTHALYLWVRNYDGVAGVQTAFDWPVSWPLLFALWNCQSNQVVGTSPTAPGPSTGTISTAFDCVQGGASAAIGVMHMIPTSPGCLTQIDSSFPFGTHVIACAGGEHTIPQEGRGSICALQDGVDACEGISPVEPATWGGIKAHYQR